MQGEREMAADNKSLGRFILDGIPPAPRGVPQVEVTFDIDANGILNVSAKDKATSKEQKITITGSTGLSKEEVEKMTKEAEANAEEDKKKKEGIETKNIADGLVYQTEKTLKENGDKVSAEVRTEVEQKLNELKEALKGDNTDDIKTKGDALGEALQKVGSAMYSQPGKDGQPATPADTSDGGPGGDSSNVGSSPNEVGKAPKDEAPKTEEAGEGEVVEEEKKNNS